MLNYLRSDIGFNHEAAKVTVTGAKGLLGRVVRESLDPEEFEVNPLDLPETDISDFATLLKATAAADVIMHFAWQGQAEGVAGGEMNPLNASMAYNVYRAAVENGISRVIMASSNHAHDHNIRDADGKIRAGIHPEVPNNLQGAEKLFIEALGRYFAKSQGLEVVCWRIGDVNNEDESLLSSPESPQCWLSQRDLGRLAVACLRTERVPGSFQVLYAVSRQEIFDWTNVFGYEPLDSAD